VSTRANAPELAAWLAKRPARDCDLAMSAYYRKWLNCRLRSVSVEVSLIQHRSTGGTKMARSDRTFVSSLSVSRIAIASGRAQQFRADLENSLRGRGIDPAPALQNLPPGDDGEAEAIARLVSLARGNGLFVQLPSAPGSSITVTTPAGAGMLQSGHDQML